MLRRALLSLGVMLALAFAGCSSDPGPGLFIASIGTLDDDCVVTASPVATAGLYDLAWGAAGSGNAYRVFPRFQNQLVARVSTAPLRGEPNGMYVEGAEITLLDPTGALLVFDSGLPNPFTTDAYTYVGPSSGASIGTSDGMIEVIPAAYVDELRSMFGPDIRFLKTEIRPFARTIGGVEVEGKPWHWTVQLCENCRNICPSTSGGGSSMGPPQCGGFDYYAWCSR